MKKLLLRCCCAAFAFLISSCDKEVGTAFNCESGNCVETPDGKYSTLEDCQNSCSNSTTGFDCISGNCEETIDGSWSSLMECQASCSDPDARYNCIDLNCLQEENGQYASLSDCESGCGNSSKKYNCVSGNCEEAANGTYSSLSACQNSCGNSGSCPSTVTDIDGNVYPVVQIGNQCWMAENLRTSNFRNGDDIPHVPDDAQWSGLGRSGAWVYYDNDQSYNNTYGKLYNWYAVDDSRNLCPAGWHVPTKNEWLTLTNHLGGKYVAGGKMKTTGTTYWDSPNANATNSSGFSGLPGGSRSYATWFDGMGRRGVWWSSTENPVVTSAGQLTHAHMSSVRSANGEINNTALEKKNAHSCRCIKD